TSGSSILRVTENTMQEAATRMAGHQKASFERRPVGSWASGFGWGFPGIGVRSVTAITRASTSMSAVPPVRRYTPPPISFRLGLGMVHQHFMLVEPMTVAENLTLGHEPRAALGAFSAADAERAVEESSRRHGLPVDPRARIRGLSVGAQQRAEILRALHHGA